MFQPTICAGQQGLVALPQTIQLSKNYQKGVTEGPEEVKRDHNGSRGQKGTQRVQKASKGDNKGQRVAQSA